MNTPAPFDQVSAARDVDYEVMEVLRLHKLFRKRWFLFLPGILQSACRVAYAAHFRTIQEFLHSGRPGKAALERVGCERPNDIHYNHFAAAQQAPMAAWTDDEIVRVCDADKLLGHLSFGRALRRGTVREEWGSESDMALWNANIAHAVNVLGPALLPRATAQLARM